MGATEVTEDTEFGGEVIDVPAAPSLPGASHPAPLGAEYSSPGRQPWVESASEYSSPGGATEAFPIEPRTRLVYVDDDAPPGGEGTSWNTAYQYLQDALTPAMSGDQIRVAQSTYKPDRDAAHPSGTGARTATFQLRNGVALYGGYAGYGAPDPDLRDIDSNASILSGDLAGNDLSGDFPNGPSYSENSYHVTTGSDTDDTAVLDGFTITAGNANGSSSPHNRGAGMYNNPGSPTLTDCTFSGNSAIGTYGGGGGMYNYNISDPTLTHCTFSGNWAANGGGMYNVSSTPTLANCTFSGDWATSGGGMHNVYYSNPTLTNCSFSGNSGGSGGGMYNAFYSNPTLTGCTFSGNSAHYGGGMQNISVSPTLTNCTFSGNAVDYDGGAVYNAQSSPTLTNCSLHDNSAAAGGGMYNNTGSPTLTNCILWGNTAPTGAQIYGGTPTVKYSDVQGGWSGAGNIAADPLFVDADGPDGIPGTEDDNLRLSPGSPCIDAGTNGALPSDSADLDGDGDTTEPIPYDLDGSLRIVDGDANGAAVVDMGAYEYRVPCDLDGDGDVDVDDYWIFVDAFGHSAGGPKYNPACDLDGDGTVTFVDYQLWLQCYRDFLG